MNGKVEKNIEIIQACGSKLNRNKIFLRESEEAIYKIQSRKKLKKTGLLYDTNNNKNRH